MTSRQVVDLARLAEEAGFDRLGISDVVFWPDCFVLLGLVARETTRIQLGPMVTNPYSRHPAVIAGIMATLQDASEWRAFLGIGIDDELVRHFAVASTPDECVDLARQTLDLGFTSASFNLAAPCAPRSTRDSRRRWSSAAKWSRVCAADLARNPQGPPCGLRARTGRAGTWRGTGAGGVLGADLPGFRVRSRREVRGGPMNDPVDPDVRSRAVAVAVAVAEST